MADDSFALVFAPPVEWGPLPVEGGQRSWCERCGTRVWVAPTSWPVLGAGGHLFCIPCGEAGMAERQAADPGDPDDAEIAATLRRLRRLRLGHDVAERGN